jgi:subtilisin family serine protease
MRNDSLYYYRGKTKVSFEVKNHLLAAAIQSDLSDKQRNKLLKFCFSLSLKSEKVGRQITQNNVLVFRYPHGANQHGKEAILKRLTKHPLVNHVGPIVHLGKQSVSFMTNELVIKFKNPVVRSKLEKNAKKSGLKVLRMLPYAPSTYLLRSKKPATYGFLDIINQLAQKDSVEFAEPNLVSTVVNHFTPNDYLFENQPHHQVINTEQAWDFTTGDGDIVIAVVDNGIAVDIDNENVTEDDGDIEIAHPDFKDLPDVDWKKLHKPFNFRGMNRDTTPSSDDYIYDHGAKCCGIATANANNNEGIAGVAPNCRLMPIRNFGNGSDVEYADMYAWIAGLEPFTPEDERHENFPQCIERGADVISNSFGIPQPEISGVMRYTLDFITDHGRDGRGCVMIFAVGNDNCDFSVLHGSDEGGCQWAAYERTIAVASSTISPPDPVEKKASSSNFGSALDVCAPGGGPPFTMAGREEEAQTISTANVGYGDTPGMDGAETDDYIGFGETSCACAQVAGIAALILSVNPDLSWEQVRQIICDTAVKIDVENTDPIGHWVDTDGDGVVDFSQWYGYGRVNAAGAVSRAWHRLPLRSHAKAPYTIENIETIIAAQELIYLRRMLATMKKYVDECPTPPPPPDPHDENVMIPLKLVQAEMNHLYELGALRAQYMNRKSVDQGLLAAVAKICRDNATMIDSQHEPDAQG